MTDPDSDRESGTADDVDPQVPAEIHRALGSTGVRLNKAHSHLAALRTVVTENRSEASEITEAELDALVHELEQSRERLNEALEIASGMRGESGSDGDESGEQKMGDEMMLWNTVGVAGLNSQET